jgi:Skp family chaperone for outer membrane proteins
MTKKPFLLIITIVLCVNVIFTWLNYSNQKNIAFFDYNEVYNDAQLKKELESDLQKVVSNRKGQLDSLQLELSFLSQTIESGKGTPDQLNEFEDMKERFLTLQNRYEEENIRLKETYFTQIRTKINDMAKLYAEKNGYQYLFAAVGDGSLMYGAETEDVTKDFKAYLNKQ